MVTASLWINQLAGKAKKGLYLAFYQEAKDCGPPPWPARFQSRSHRSQLVTTSGRRMGHVRPQAGVETAVPASGRSNETLHLLYSDTVQEGWSSNGCSPDMAGSPADLTMVEATDAIHYLQRVRSGS